MSLRARKKQSTLAAIIKAAASLFAEQGYESTKTRQIAARAGIATGTLFNYAATKEDVVVLLWKSKANQALAKGLVPAQQAADDPVNSMVALFTPIFAFYAEDKELGRIFLRSVIYRTSDDPEMMALNEGFIAQISMLLAPATDEPLFAAMNVFSAYYTVLTMMLGERLQTTEDAVQLFRSLVMTQQRGFRST